MKSFLCFIACVFPLVILAGNPQEVVDGNNKFAFKLLHQMQPGVPGQNLFYSPFSISTAMAMVYAGARNETAVQMSRTLNFQPNGKFHSEFRQLLNGLNGGTDGSIKLNIANGLWAQNDFQFLDAYIDLVKSNYNSELKNVSFTDDLERETTRKEINAWVEQKTNDKIRNLLGRNDLSSLTRLVLVNAIYFYGDWAEPFKKESTKTKEFSSMDGLKDTLPFMNRQGRFNYYEDQKIQVLEVPYRDNKASMVIFLPNTTNGITALEQTLDYKYYQDIVGTFQPDDVSLSLPKFKTDFKLELGRTLAQMGMPLAFSPNGADFSGMTGKRDLYISAVIHQAFINVDEKGTEAAAATAVVMKVGMGPHPRNMKVFKADHPFIFLIKDNATGSILFMGKIMKPGVSE